MTSATPSASDSDGSPTKRRGPNEVFKMTHIEEEKVTKTTTYERVADPPKEPVKNVNLNVNTDNDGEAVTVDNTTTETTETTDESQPQVNVNIAR